VDEKEVIIGGFSSGGTAALEVSLGNVFPVVGFVARY
jgi:predicted esterase